MMVIKFIATLGWLLLISALIAALGPISNWKEVAASDAIFLIIQILIGISFIVNTRKFNDNHEKYITRLIYTTWLAILYILGLTFNIGWRDYNEFGFTPISFVVPLLFLLIAIPTFGWMLNKLKNLPKYNKE